MTTSVTSGVVAKQPNGLVTILSLKLVWPESPQPAGRAGLSLLEMQARFGRRSGLVKESTGELPWPVPELGLFLEPRDRVTERRLRLSFEVDFAKSEALPTSILGS